MSIFGSIAHGLSSAGHAVAHTAEDADRDFTGAVKTAAGDVGRGVKDAADEVGHAAKDVGEVVEKMSPSDLGHTALDLLGMVPVVGTAANLVNAGWYAATGDWKDAATSALGAIPVEGDAVDAVKLGEDGVKIAKDTVTAEHAITDTEHAASDVEDVADTTETTASKAPDAAGADAGSDPAVWVQHGREAGPIREYRPEEVQGTPEVGSRVSTSNGRGTVVSRGDPPNRSDVRLATPVDTRPTLEEEVQQITNDVRNQVEKETVDKGGHRSGQSVGAQRNITVGNRLIQKGNEFINKGMNNLGKMLKTEGQRLIKKGGADEHPGGRR